MLILSGKNIFNTFNFQREENQREPDLRQKLKKITHIFLSSIYKG